MGIFKLFSKKKSQKEVLQILLYSTQEIFQQIADHININDYEELTILSYFIATQGYIDASQKNSTPANEIQDIVIAMINIANEHLSEDTESQLQRIQSRFNQYIESYSSGKYYITAQEFLNNCDNDDTASKMDLSVYLKKTHPIMVAGIQKEL